MVNHDGAGGTAPDALVWSAGSPRQKRRPVQAVRDFAMVPGPAHIWILSGLGFVRILLMMLMFLLGLLLSLCWSKIVAFLDTLHWPAQVIWEVGCL